MSTQLIDPRNFNTKNIVFSKNKHRSIPDKNISYQSMNISYRNKETGSIGDFLITTPVLYSFGVNPNFDMNNKEIITNYSMGLCLHSSHGATPEEVAFEDMMMSIADACKTEMVRQKVTFNGEPVEPSDVRRLTCLKFPKDKITKEIKKDSGPRMYVRLIDSRGDNNNIVVRALFYDTAGKPVDPLEVGRCRAKVVIKVTSIFIGSVMAIQLRIQEAYVDQIDNNIRPMLSTQNMAAMFGVAPPPPEDEGDDSSGETPLPKKTSPKRSAEENVLSDDDYTDDDSVISN